MLDRWGDEFRRVRDSLSEEVALELAGRAVGIYYTIALGRDERRA
jgi:hypothetical protein